MAITPLGVVGAGSSSGLDHVDVTLTAPVIASTPTLAQHVAIMLQATGPAHQALTGITDNAVTNPLYGTCYGTGNPYRRLGVETGGSAFDEDLQGGLILHGLAIGNVIRVQYAGAWSHIEALAIAFSGGLADPSPFSGPGFACVVPTDLGGAPTADPAVYFNDPQNPSGVGACQRNAGHVLQPGADWDWPASLAYYIATAFVYGGGAVGSWSWDDAGLVSRGGWIAAGATPSSAQLADKLAAGPLGPHVGVDPLLGGCWGIPVPAINCSNSAVGIATGLGPPYCGAPPPPVSGKRKCCGSRCTCLTTQLPAGGMLQVLNSSGAPIFEVRDDGTVHILTGQTVIADL